ncbi:MAG: DNA primase [Geminicoccaceae bacterium]|nr:DNA primase [Geminicoccaceae bacterium]
MSHDGESTLEAFKARLSLADIVGRHVRLTRRGREYTGLCPFHKEKSPSFSVVEDKGFYHCFGCGAHGDVIRFVMEIEGLEFPEALARLADMTGIEPPRRRVDKAERTAPGLAEANAAAMRFFEERLHSSQGRGALAYLERRQVGHEVRERFRLGYAPPGRHDLKGWLHEQGFAESLAVEAGLLIRPDDGGTAYDRFRERLVFPIEDMRGRIVGFGGRALADQRAKYLNSPETPLFHKGTLLFGLPLASRAAKEAGRIVLVEGYMDVVAMSEAGIAETVAPLGTAVTEEQLRLLWRYADEPVVCLDGDKAGFAAALRAARRALPVMQGGQSLRFALLPEGDDPDTFIRSRGRAAMDGLLRAAMPLSRLIWQAELTAGPVATPEQLAGLRQRLMDYAALASDHALAGFLRQQFDELIRARRPQRQGAWRRDGRGSGAWGSGRHDAKGGPRSSSQGWDRSPQLGSGLQSGEAASAIRALALFLLDPGLLHHHEEDLLNLEFADPRHDRVRNEILSCFATHGDLDQQVLDHHLTSSGCDELVRKVIDTLGPLPGGGAVDRVAAGQMFATMRLRAARNRELEEYASALSERRYTELDVRRRSQDELLNGLPEGGFPGLPGEK